MSVVLILCFAIVANATANILIKVGMNRVGEGKGLLPTVMSGALQPAIIFGIVFFVLALAAYTYVLSRINLSIAYPIMTSMGFVLVILVSWLFLKETVTLYQLLGFVLIIAGVWLVAR